MDELLIFLVGALFGLCISMIVIVFTNRTKRTEYSTEYAVEKPQPKYFENWKSQGVSLEPIGSHASNPFPAPPSRTWISLEPVGSHDTDPFAAQD